MIKTSACWYLTIKNLRWQDFFGWKWHIVLVAYESFALWSYDSRELHSSHIHKTWDNGNPIRSTSNSVWWRGDGFSQSWWNTWQEGSVALWLPPSKSDFQVGSSSRSILEYCHDLGKEVKTRTRWQLLPTAWLLPHKYHRLAWSWWGIMALPWQNSMNMILNIKPLLIFQSFYMSNEDNSWQVVGNIYIYISAKQIQRAIQISWLSSVDEGSTQASRDACQIFLLLAARWTVLWLRNLSP